MIVQACNTFDRFGAFRAAAGVAVRAAFSIVGPSGIASDLTGRSVVWRFLDHLNAAVPIGTDAAGLIAGTIGETLATFDLSGALTESLRTKGVASFEIAMLIGTGRVVLHRGAATIEDAAPFVIGTDGAAGTTTLTVMAGSSTLVVPAQGAPGSSSEAIAAAALANAAAADSVTKTAATVTATGAAIAATTECAVKTAVAATATGKADAAAAAAKEAADDSVAKTALTVTAANAANAGATAANTAAAQIVPEGGPSLLIKPGTGTFPSVADVYFTGSKSLYSNFDGLRRQLRGFADVLDFARATPGTFFDAAGVLQTAPSGTARLGYRFNTASSKWVLAGLLIEAQDTEYVTNSAFNGAVVGIVGSGGVLPAGFSFGANSMTREIVAKGVINGMSYIDVRWSGISTSTYIELIKQTPSITTAVGTTWTAGIYVALVAGSLTGIGQFAVQPSPSEAPKVFTPGPTLTNIVSTGVLAGAIAALTLRAVAANTTSSLDFTIRFALPQLRLASSLSSPILTTSAQVTRAGDLFTKALGVEFNPAAQTALFTAVTPTDGAGDLSYWVWSNGTDSLRFFHRATTKVFFLLLSLNGTQSAVNGPTVTPDTAYKIAIGFSGKMIRLVVNGIAYADNAGNAGIASGPFTSRRIGVGSGTTTQPNAFIMPYLPHPTNPLLDATEFPRLLSVAEMQTYTA